MKIWEEKIDKFIELCTDKDVRMILVGGGAVNFHGYQRHSADVDFWIDVEESNLKKLVWVFQQMGYHAQDFPDSVKNKEQNISVKFSPVDLDLELITNFSSYISFEEAYKQAEIFETKGFQVLRWRVLSLENLIETKIRAGRNKDLLDVMELKKIQDSKK